MHTTAYTLIHLLRQSLMIGVASVTLANCSPYRLHTIWTTSSSTAVCDKDKTVLVLCLLDDADTFTRLSVESMTVKQLAASGISSVTAWELWGVQAASLSPNEQSLLSLRAKGIDRVIVITCLDKYKADLRSTVATNNYPVSYFYQRMVSYPLLRAAGENAGTAYWEIMLVDLEQLEPVTVSRSRPHYLPFTLDMSHHLPQQIVEQLCGQRNLRSRR
ncbi:hypothetical protein [Paraflavitalea pollutisoli]|uniref:hypothetical protein n=1 Tax=Paraflavitalea pollutisoli TaxID=3034143 RepID=UPI0023EDC565|nr:hypothetical protein [Paraflavitalea sp. H1-2-19X]